MFWWSSALYLDLFIFCNDKDILSVKNHLFAVFADMVDEQTDAANVSHLRANKTIFLTQMWESCGALLDIKILSILCFTQAKILWDYFDWVHLFTFTLIKLRKKVFIIIINSLFLVSSLPRMSASTKHFLGLDLLIQWKYFVKWQEVTRNLWSFHFQFFFKNNL